MFVRVYEIMDPQTAYWSSILLRVEEIHGTNPNQFTTWAICKLIIAFTTNEAPGLTNQAKVTLSLFFCFWSLELSCSALNNLLVDPTLGNPI